MMKRELMGKERGDEGVQMHAVEILEICEGVGVKVEYMNWVSALSFRLLPCPFLANSFPSHSSYHALFFSPHHIVNAHARYSNHSSTNVPTKSPWLSLLRKNAGGGWMRGWTMREVHGGRF